jgi:radical SAM protein with 4Fe4S-binding SPASM domain
VIEDPGATPWVHGFILLRAERSGVIANNPRLSRQATLGPETASSLELFDGTRTVREISYMSRKRFGGSASAAAARVRGAMEALDGIGALSTSRLGTPRPPRIVKPARFIDDYPSAPRSVIWEVTSACDLACAHCLADAGRRGKNELDTAGALRIVDRLAEAGVFSVNLAGGEPFLRPDLFAIIDALVESRIEVDVSTNGFALDDDTIRELSKRPVYTVQVSVDGSREQHDDFRGRAGSFDAAIGSLERLKAAGFITSLSTVVTRRTIHSLAYVADLAASLGCSSFKALPFLPAGRGAGKKGDLALGGSELIEFARTLVAMRDRYKGRMSLFMESAMPFLLEQPCSCGCHGDGTNDFGAHGDSLVGCSAGRDSLYVGSDGTAYPCPFFKDFPLGDLTHSSLVDVWADAPFLWKLREMTAADLAGECGACEYLGTVCFGGCRAAAWLDSGDVLGSDPICYKKALEAEALT